MEKEISVTLITVIGMLLSASLTEFVRYLTKGREYKLKILELSFLEKIKECKSAIEEICAVRDNLDKIRIKQDEEECEKDKIICAYQYYIEKKYKNEFVLGYANVYHKYRYLLKESKKKSFEEKTRKERAKLDEQNKIISTIKIKLPLNFKIEKYTENSEQVVESLVSMITEIFEYRSNMVNYNENLRRQLLEMFEEELSEIVNIKK